MNYPRPIQHYVSNMPDFNSSMSFSMIRNGEQNSGNEFNSPFVTQEITTIDPTIYEEVLMSLPFAEPLISLNGENNGSHEAFVPEKTPEDTQNAHDPLVIEPPPTDVVLPTPPPSTEIRTHLMPTNIDESNANRSDMNEMRPSQAVRELFGMRIVTNTERRNKNAI